MSSLLLWTVKGSFFMNDEDRIQSAINQLSEEVTSLRRQLDEEKRKNAENQKEWDEFFFAAHLKNPITGEIITSREDFYNFKKQKESISQRGYQSNTRYYTESQPPKSNRGSIGKYAIVFSIVIVSIVAIFLFRSYIGTGGKTIAEDTLTNQTIEPQLGAQYVGSTNSDIFHRITCRHAQKIAPGNSIYYDTISDAIKDGRKKCSTCFATQ